MRHNEQCVCAAASEAEAAQSQAENLLGDWRALLRQMGSADSPMLCWPAAFEALPSLNDFLSDYASRFLLPRELPAIVEACGHARRGEWRELLAQDLRLEETMQSSPFAEASRSIGRLQLARLRPLRDERSVQRYRAAAQAGQAHGWHMMVYGVTLAVYSMPLRQGLLHYAHETLTGLASAAGRSMNLRELELADMLARLLSRVPEAAAAALQREGSFSQASMAGETAA